MSIYSVFFSLIRHYARYNLVDIYISMSRIHRHRGSHAGKRLQRKQMHAFYTCSLCGKDRIRRRFLLFLRDRRWRFIIIIGIIPFGLFPLLFVYDLIRTLSLCNPLWWSTDEDCFDCFGEINQILLFSFLFLIGGCSIVKCDGFKNSSI